MCNLTDVLRIEVIKEIELGIVIIVTVIFTNLVNDRLLE
jgi:hypothetical protein